MGTRQNNKDTDRSTTTAKKIAAPKEKVKGENMLLYLERLAGRLGRKGPLQNKAEKTAGEPNRSIRDIMTIQGSREEHSSYLWIKIANEQANYIREETQKLPVFKTLMRIAEAQDNTKKVQDYQKNQLKRVQNISNALSTYSYCMRQISRNGTNATQNGFAKYLLFLTKYHNNEQMEIFKRVRKHFAEFQKKKQINPKKWKNEMIHLN